MYCIALYGIAIAWYSGFLPPSQPVTSSWRLPGQIMSAWQVWNLIHKSWKCYECWWAAWILLQLICQERAFYSSCAIYGYCLSTSCNSLYIFAPLLLYQTMQAPNEHIIYGYCNTLWLGAMQKVLVLVLLFSRDVIYGYCLWPRGHDPQPMYRRGSPRSHLQITICICSALYSNTSGMMKEKKRRRWRSFWFQEAVVPFSPSGRSNGVWGSQTASAVNFTSLVLIRSIRHDFGWPFAPSKCNNPKMCQTLDVGLADWRDIP